MLGGLSRPARHWWHQYYYGTDQAVVRLPGAPFVTPPRVRHAVAWAVGDGADGGDSAKGLARRIAAAHPTLFLYLGDVYSRGLASEFRDHYATVYGRLAARTAPTPGNHEWGHHLSGYDPYWRRVTHRAPPAFYSYALAGWRLLSLNSEAPHDPKSSQVRWLAGQVRARGTCTIGYWHRPRFSAGSHGDQKDVAPLWDTLRGHASIVLNGHDHDMQRFRRTDGMMEFVVGSGGHGRYPVDRSDARLAFANDAAYGALRLDLRPGRAAWTFVAADGRTLDSGALTCRRRPA